MKDILTEQMEAAITMLRRHADELEITKRSLENKLALKEEIRQINRQASEIRSITEDIRGVGEQ